MTNASRCDEILFLGNLRPTTPDTEEHSSSETVAILTPEVITGELLDAVIREWRERNLPGIIVHQRGTIEQGRSNIDIVRGEQVPEDIHNKPYIHKEGYAHDPEPMEHADGIIRAGAGHNNIPTNLPVPYTNAPGKNAPGVAEWAWTAMAAHLKGMQDMTRHVKGGAVFGNKLTKEKPRDPQQARIGIIGLGAIGKLVAGHAFHHQTGEVRAYDPYQEDFIENTEWGDDRRKIEASTIEAMCRDSDCITLHCPATADGEPVLTSEHFKILDEKFEPTGKSTLILNAARYDVIDEDALLASLRKGSVRLAIDVFENEKAENPWHTGDVLNQELVEQTRIDPKNEVMLHHIAGYASLVLYGKESGHPEELIALALQQLQEYEFDPNKLSTQAKIVLHANCVLATPHVGGNSDFCQQQTQIAALEKAAHLATTGVLPKMLNAEGEPIGPRTSVGVRLVYTYRETTGVTAKITQIFGQEGHNISIRTARQFTGKHIGVIVVDVIDTNASLEQILKANEEVERLEFVNRGRAMYFNTREALMSLLEEGTVEVSKE